jgi:hypothetical protein
MFIVTTTLVERPSSVGAAWRGILAPTDIGRRSSKHKNMPPLRSLANGAAPVAIDMALLTELSAAPPPHLRRVRDARKEQRLHLQDRVPGC